MSLLAYEAERSRLSDIDEQNVQTWFRHVLETRTVAPRHPSLNALLSHYESLPRGEGGMPHKSAMRPSDLKGHLADLFWLEIQTDDFEKAEAIAPGDLLFRVFGSNIAEMVGAEMTGRTLAEGPFEKTRALAVLGIKVAVEKGGPLRVKGPILVRDSEPMYVEALIMPFTDDEGRPRFILGEAHDVTL